jgi:phenylpropionate dioxygenase-like ring-hydroxylating dioxygenase large terminal subunit
MIEISELVKADEGLLHPEIYINDEVYNLELENIFGRSWLFLAHDSMIPKAGDFLQTYMAEDPVLVVRQRDGSVKAFLNQCRHRGMRICRADAGNIKAFTCTYHGWTYDIAGRLINVPHEEDGYHNELDKDAWGPIQVTKIENYKGFWFGTWDESAPSFADYLGEFAWYFDAHIDRTPGGVEAMGAAQKWVIDCNWKFAAEQFASDNYHAEISHASATIVLAPQQGIDVEEALRRRTLGGRQYSDPHGHGTGLSISPGPHVRGPFSPSEDVRAWNEEVRDSVIERLGEVRADWARGHSTIFPNFSYLPNGTMRVWHPRGPNQIEVWAWTFVPADAPDQVKQDIRKATLRTFSAAGLFEQDDGENWNEIQKVLRGYIARKHMLNAQMGLGHADRDEFVPGDRIFKNRIGEEAARGLYRRWAEMMAASSWEEILEGEKARKRVTEKV